MSREDLFEVARKQPFVPFQVVISTGDTYDIRHPDMIMIGRRSAFLGIASEANPRIFNRGFLVDLLHIVGTKELPASSDASTNGAPQTPG